MLSNLRPWRKRAGNDNNRPSASSRKPRRHPRESATTVDKAPGDSKIQVVIDCQEQILSVAALADGKHVIGSDDKGWIRKWRIQDGAEVDTSLDDSENSWVLDISASLQDGQEIVGGTKRGWVDVWNAQSEEIVAEFQAHSDWVLSVDISSDGTRIATGSDDCTASVWSRWTGDQLLQLKHNYSVVAAKFSPDGQLLATVTWQHGFLRVYDARRGNLLADLPIGVSNRSIVWSRDSKQLFALSRDGIIHCLDPYSGTLLSKWSIHSSDDVNCIALDNSGTLILASAGRSVSFWSTTSHAQIGPSAFKYGHRISSMAISRSNTLVLSGDNLITVTAPLQPDICKTLQGLRDELSNARNTAKQQKNTLSTFVDSLRAGVIEKLPGTNHDESARQHQEPSNSQRTVHQSEHSFDECISSLREILHARDEYFSETIRDLRIQLTQEQEKADLFTRIMYAHEQSLKCESLFSQGHIHEAAHSFLNFKSTLHDDVRANTLIANWVAEFAQRCVTVLERIGDEASSSDRRNDAIIFYSAALELGSSSPTILTNWTRAILVQHPVEHALNAAFKFKVPRFMAVECFLEAQDKLVADDGTNIEQTKWGIEFRVRLVDRLEELGDIAKEAKNHEMTIQYYSTALKLNPTNTNDIYLKQSNEKIELNPSSHMGYESKHAALHAMGCFSEAFEAFKTMLSIIDTSTDPRTLELRRLYVDATPEIQAEVDKVVQDMPRVLIDTDTGHLYDKTRQATAFEGLPIYDELRSSMTTQLDRARIRHEVKKFYCYVMFSHRWQPHEPTFQTVENLSIYELPASSAFSKLKNFCKLVHTLGFKWAWSDTCCVNQLDRAVQQESLVAMFRWYRGSSLTIIHLLGVSSKSQKIGALWQSIWNTRGWTYQEYLASEVVQFYTEDWQPYLGLEMFNHKESPVILSEMEQAMSFKTKELVTLHPGFDRAREKLFLASNRQTTREEDRAYSLFGIFSVSLPVIYGEGNQAIGRLLEHILTRSDNVTLLAWTGRSGSQHSYLPADLGVYNQIVPPHILAPVDVANIEDLARTMRTSSSNISDATAVYEKCYNLPPLSLVAGRLRLPGIVFPLADLVRLSPPDGEHNIRVYRGTSPMLGDVEIQTRDELSGLNALLIHPWTSPLLDLDFSGGEALFDAATRALRLVIRLKQPFGALLLAPLARAQYKRVATDSLIMVRVQEKTSLSELMDSVRTIDIQ